MASKFREGFKSGLSRNYGTMKIVLDNRCATLVECSFMEKTEMPFKTKASLSVSTTS